MKSYRFILLTSLSLILLSCKNGCTSNHTYDSDSTTRTVQGEDVRITAKIIDIRHSKSFGKNVLNNNVSHSYSVNLSFGFRDEQHISFYSFPINDPDLTDLDDELDNIKLDISKNKEHLAVGYKSELIEVFHFYDGKELGRIYNDDPTGKSWNQRNLSNIIPVEDALINQLKSCDIIYEKDKVRKVHAKLPGDHEINRILLKNYSECFDVQTYFEEESKRLSKDPKWVDLFCLELQKIEFSPLTKGMIELATELNKPKINVILDSILIANLDNSSFYNRGVYLMTRLNNKTDPISKENQELLLEYSNDYIENANETFHDTRHYPIAPMIAIQKNNGSEEKVLEFLEKKVNTSVSYIDRDIWKYLLENEKELTVNQRNYLIENADAILIEHYDTFEDDMVSFYFKILSNTEFVALKQKHKLKV